MRTSGSGTNRIDRTRSPKPATRAARGDDLPSLRSLATAIRRPASARLPKDQAFLIAERITTVSAFDPFPPGPLFSETRRRHRLRKFLIGATEFKT